MSQHAELTWTREMVTRFWDYERRHPENFFSFQVGAVIARKFQKHFPTEADVVDYGAGRGFLIEDLLAKGMRCGAVEFGDEAVSELNQRFRQEPLFLGARSHETPDDWRGKFDGAFLLEVVEHLYDPELVTALSAVHELLKPGGVLIVTTPNEEDRSKSFVCSPESGLLFHRFQHVRSWSAASLSSFLEGQGFTCLETGATDFGASTLALRRTVSWPLRLARSLAKHVLGQRPHLYAVVKRV
jgi:2-polyprenyl-3-methyl-5-hydroxy-6-metoxy-1,4-benzoquinol methylase